MIIELPSEMDSALTQAAEKHGTTPELFVEEIVRERLIEVAPAAPGEKARSLADRLAGFIGILHSSEHVPGGARMSECTGEQFAAGMMEKRAQGRL